MGMHHVELVDPKGLGVARLDLVRTFSNDLEAHVLHHRQRIRRRNSLAAGKQLHPHAAFRFHYGPIEGYSEIVGATHRLHTIDIDGGGTSLEVLTIPTGESIAVDVVERGAPFFAVAFDQGISQVILPGSGGLDNLGLDLLQVIINAGGRIRVNDELKPRQYRFREQRIELHAGTVKCVH